MGGFVVVVIERAMMLFGLFSSVCSLFLFTAQPLFANDNPSPNAAKQEDPPAAAEAQVEDPAAGQTQPGLLDRARTLLATAADDLDPDELQALIQALEEDVPVRMTALQEQKQKVVDIRINGRSHPDLQPLMQQLKDLEQQISEAIGQLPELQAAEQQASVANQALLETMRLRVQLKQKLGRINRDQGENTPASDPASQSIEPPSE